MKKRIGILLLLAIFLLSACGFGPTATSGIDTVDLGGSGIAGAAFVQDTLAPELDYDEIQPVADTGADPAMILPGYFTVCKGGKWGLIRADGTELLPCEALVPVQWEKGYFSDDGSLTGHFRWVNTAWYHGGWKEYEAFAADAKNQYGIDICIGGHGITSTGFCYVVYDDGSASVLCDHNSEGFLNLTPVWEETRAMYGDWLPVRSARVNGGDEDPEFVEEWLTQYWYINAATDEKLTQEYRRANWFGREPLAPVETENGNWMYLDTTGAPATEAAYAPTYAPILEWMENGEQKCHGSYLAAGLQNGYAAVHRAGEENGWGVLDDTGTEIIPAENAGAAWEGTALWLRKTAEAPWQCYLPA